MAHQEIEMTVNEKLILEIDLLHPAFMVRPDLSRIRVGQSSRDEMIPTQEISFNEAGRIKSMLHTNLGWIACPPGNIPPLKIDRLTEFQFKLDSSHNLESETRDLKTKDLLRQEEYLFEFNKLRTIRFVIIDSVLPTKMVSESNYVYDKNRLLVQIETQISSDSSVRSNSIIALDREQNGLIRMKKISKVGENEELELISTTTYNYDSENRLKNSITSKERMVLTREYQYENKGYPQNLSLITEKDLSGLTRTIRNEFNDRGDRRRTIISDGDIVNITEYEYEYAT